MGIRAKLTLAVGIPMVAILALTGFGWFQMDATHTSSEELVSRHFIPLVDHDMPELNGLQRATRLLLDADRGMHQVVIAEKMALVSTSDTELRAADELSQEQLERSWDMVEEASTYFTEEMQPAYQQLKEAHAAWQEKTRKVIEQAWDPNLLHFARKISDGSGHTAFVELRALTAGLIQQLQAQVDAGMDAMSQRRELLNGVMEETQDAHNTAVWLYLIGGAVSLIVASLIATLVATSLLRPLRGVIRALTDNSSRLEDASAQLRHASSQLAEGASEQASSLEESSASLSELGAMVKQNADSSAEARRQASDVRQAAQVSQEALGRLDSAMERIQDSANRTASIIKTIDEIAFQTNLLALNAAVEAARAGDAGKGFAVVAEEVRNLAQRSASAAQETAALIQQSQESAGEGVAVGGEVEQVLGQVVQGVTTVSQLITEVAAASGEQARGIDQVGTAVQRMEMTTQSTSALSEEQASSSHELARQADELQQVVARLVQIVTGVHQIRPGAVTRQPGETAHTDRAPGIRQAVAARTRADASGRPR